MANGRRKTRLELTWIGKEERPKLEPRILLEDPEKSYHASVRRPGDIFDNMLIHGDNLLALKALEADFAGQVKCIYIDPPYNTGSAFAEYEDGLEHSLWLNLMHARLSILRDLLSPEGTLWVQLDDNEAHYAKVMLDEIFGRANFVANIVWNKSYAVRSNALHFSTSHEHVLVYSKDSTQLNLNKFTRSDKQLDRYKNPDNDPRGPWQSVTMTISLVGGARGRQYAKTGHSDNIYEVVSPSGKKFLPPKNRCWSRTKPGFKELDAEKRIWWGDNGDRVPRLKKFLSESDEGVLPTTLWADGEQFGLNQQGVREIAGLGLPSFPTPKPERLLEAVIRLATDPGDLVLDSFAGTGTTGAVAHKLGRRWIAVELNDHCLTHAQPRMERVVEGEQGGISEAVEWQGGGGFRYYRLAPSLLQKDEYGNWIINKDYNAAMLAEALCKIEGFKYDPSPEVYWQQGRSTETDYIFVTTQTMTADMLQKLSDEVGPDRSLLVMCKAFRSKREWPNLTVKKIPKAVLAKCEWGQDDYSLEIKELPVVEDEPEAADGGTQVEPKTNGAVKTRRRKAAAVASGNLFAGETDDGDQEGD